jgi:hypothetical protein
VIELSADKLRPAFGITLYNSGNDKYCGRWSKFLLSAKSLMPWPRAIGRTMDPSWVDCRMLRGWIDSCDQDHGNACKIFAKYSFASKKPTWLVDVRRQCIIKVSNEHQYVSLSYVWGTEDFLTSNCMNIQTLQVPGALSMESIKSKIPTTIRDAMKLVHALGFQYLWVDALCIVQDDSAQKHQDIANMPGIYANAVLTIIACQGTGAHDGLLVTKHVFPENTRLSRSLSETNFSFYCLHQNSGTSLLNMNAGLQNGETEDGHYRKRYSHAGNLSSKRILWVGNVQMLGGRRRRKKEPNVMPADSMDGTTIVCSEKGLSKWTDLAISSFFSTRGNSLIQRIYYQRSMEWRLS